MENHPYLKLWWHPGMVYEPVQRWVSFEMVPVLGWIDDMLLDDIKGPSPRVNGEWKEDASVPGRKRWRSKSIHSLEQWEIFQETGHYPILFWIIQGDFGGHKWQLSPQEQKLLAMAGHQPTDTPAPGDLDYAPFDERVVENLLKYNTLQSRDKELYLTERRYTKESAIAIVGKQKSFAEENFRRELQEFLRRQVQQTLEIHWDIVKKAVDELGIPEGDRHYNRNEDAEEEAFITGG